MRVVHGRDGALTVVSRRCFVVVLAIAMMGLAACSSGSGGGGDASAGPAIPPNFTSAFDAGLTADGQVSLKLALAAFTTAIGPLPGVSVKHLPRRGLTSGSLAVDALLAHWDELTAAQQHAASDLLVGPGGKRVAQAIPVPDSVGGPGKSVPARVTGDALTDEVSVDLGRARREIERKFQHPLGLTLEWGFGPVSGGAAQALPTDAAGNLVTSGRATHCFVTVVRSAVADGTAAQVYQAMVHEVWHCFQHDVAGSASLSLAPWIREGQATWVGFSVSGLELRGTTLVDWWNSWLNNGATALFRRSYDAVGFYATLEQNAGIDPWSVLRAMLLAGSNDGALAAATNGEGAPFVSVIGRAVTRVPALGQVWEARGPGITSVRYTRSVDVAPGNAVHLSKHVAAHSAAGFELHLSGDVLTVTTNAPFGAIGMTGNLGERFTGPYEQTFCLMDHACECPSSASVVSQFAQGSRGLGALAVGAGASDLAATSTLQAFTIDDFCHQRPRAACFPGTYHPTATPELNAQAQQALSHLPGFHGIDGGILGRKIEFTAGGQWSATDDGSDPITASGELPGAGHFDTAIPVVSSASGTYATTAGNHITFTTSTYRYAENPPIVTIQVQGNTIEVPFPEAEVRSLGTFNGSGTFLCHGPNLLLDLDQTTITLKRV